MTLGKRVRGIRAIRIRAATQQLIDGLLDDSFDGATVPLGAEVRESTNPEITGQRGHYVRVEMWFYVWAGIEHEAADAS